MVKRKRRSRKKNLSTGAWVVIGLGVGVGLPVLVVGALTIYGIRKASKLAKDRPIPAIPTFPS